MITTSALVQCQNLEPGSSKRRFCSIPLREKWRFDQRILLFSVMTICFFLLATHCAKPMIITKSYISVEEQFESAMNNFKSKFYDKAIKGFSDIIFNYPGSRYAADAQYYLAMAYFEKRDYSQAITEFDFFIRNFSTSPFLESAIVKLALAYLRQSSNIERDQSQLLKAQELLEKVSEGFEDSEFRSEIESAKQELLERLAQKDFAAGNLYFRAQEYEAAIIYYEHIVNEYPLTSWALRAKLPLAISYVKTDNRTKAKSLLEELINDNSNKELQRKAQAQLKRFFLK